MVRRADQLLLPVNPLFMWGSVLVAIPALRLDFLGAHCFGVSYQQQSQARHQMFLVTSWGLSSALLKGQAGLET